MAKNCKYQKYQKYISYDNGATWQPMQEFQKGELIEASSTDCGGGTVVYQWVVDSYYCNNSDRYATEKKQVSYNNGQSWEDVVPTETKNTLVERNSPYCHSYQYRWVESGTTCIGYDLWQNNIRQVSTDGGETWENVSPPEYSASTLIEHNSEDCGYVPPIQYRWYPSGTTCIEYDKYQNNIKQVSYDYGQTWENVSPPEYSASTCIEVLSEECGYVLTEAALLRGSGSSYTLIPCNCSSSLTVTELERIQGSSYITSATIGDCVIRLGNDAFADYISLKKITLPSTLKVIGEDAFFRCKSLESLTIPSGVCAWSGHSHFESYMDSLNNLTIEYGVPNIPGRAFVDCTALTTVTIPDTVAFIGDEAFQKCTSLTSVTIGSGIEEIGNSSFAYCNGLTSVTIGESINVIGGGAFAYCTNLQSITIKSLNPPSISGTTFDSTNNCSIYVPTASVSAYQSATNWSTLADRIIGVEMDMETPPAKHIKWISSNGQKGYYNGSDELMNNEVTNYQTTTQLWVQDGVTWIDGDISNPSPTYSQLREVSLPDTLLHIGSAFYGCAYLTTITIPNNVEIIGTYAFRYCQTLSSVTIGCSVQFIGAYAFNSCPDLVEVTCLATTPPEIFSTTFGGMSSSKTFYVPCESVEAYKTAEGWSQYASSIQCFEPSVKYRWYPSGTTCIGYDKYQNTIRQVSNDGGLTWENVSPPEYSASTVIEYDSEDCGYVPLVIAKWVATYTGGTTSSAECDSSSAITKDEVPTKGSAAIGSSVEIGDCVTSIGDKAFACHSLTSITIPDSVTSIGNYAFSGCSSLSNITIGSGLTSIGQHAFSGCRSLTSITIPSGVTNIGAWAFVDCENLTSITIPSGVTNIGAWAFNGCASLTSITIPSRVTSIGDGAFSEDLSLTAITIPSGVTNIGSWAFEGCSGLTSITVLAVTPPTLGSNVFTNTNNCPIYVPCSSVDSYKSAWTSLASRIQPIQPCTLYRWVESGTTCIGYDKYQNNIKQQSTDGGQTWENVIPEEYSASTVIEYDSEDCGYVFDGKWKARYTGGTTSSAQCDSSSAITSGEISTHSAVTSVQIGDCVTNINDYGLAYCRNLSSIKIPDNVTSIGNYAFQQCFGLTSLSIGSGVTSIGDRAFNQCFALTSVTIPDNVTSIGTAAFNYCSGLTSANIGSGISSISSSAFTLCYNLKEVTIPNSVTSIGSDAFYYCSSLSSVTIPSSVTSIGIAAFNGCSGLTSITIEATTPPTLSYNTFNNTNNCTIYVPCASVNSYKNAWTSLASRIQGIPPCEPTGSTKWVATYSDSHTESAECDSSSAITSGEIDLSGLTSVTINDCVTSIGRDAFYLCRSLSSVTMPNSVTSIGMYAFQECAFSSFIIPESVTSINDSAFMGCTSLTAITIPSSITSINDQTFVLCTRLSSVTIPNSVTSIGTSAFMSCTRLPSIIIPSGVTSIGYQAFNSCYSLDSLTILAQTPPSLGNNAFSNTASNLVIYVPSGSVNAYKSASGWSTYASRIQAIPNS